MEPSTGGPWTARTRWPNPPLGPASRVVVVGAGLAGARACAELRSRGYVGELVLLGAEQHPPYDRPPLSKAFLTDPGEWPPPEGTGRDRVQVGLDPEWYAAADLRTGVSATGLRAGAVTTTGGELEWDALVLAVGAAPVRFPVGARGEGTHVLRTLGDAVRLRAALRDGGRVVVVGAGWIGAEVTTAALRQGCAVTVVEAAAAPLAVPLGAQVGARTAPWYVAAGAELRTGTRACAVDGGGVVLDGGERLDADVVVEALGVRRDLDWLAGSGVAVDGGVLTDAACRTTLPGVVAVGDCARRWSPRAARGFLLEHWDDALNGPGVAARVLLGELSASYDPVPYVWSEQFDRYLQWVGWRDGEPAAWRGDPGDRGWAAAWTGAGGALTGFLAVDRPRDLLQARRLIAAGAVPDLARLRDPDVAVRDCVAAVTG